MQNHDRPSHHGSNSSLASTTSSASQPHTLDSKDAKVLQQAIMQHVR